MAQKQLYQQRSGAPITYMQMLLTCVAAGSGEFSRLQLLELLNP
jgi:hypothetical protein